MTGWVTYERRHWRGAGSITITKLEAEPAPRQGNYSMRRATQEEIDAEVAKRDEAASALQAGQQFRAKPEYAEAVRIGGIIEHMTPDNNPLNKLTLEQWIALRKTLEG